MKHRVWKAGLLMVALTGIAGSTVFAAAGTGTTSQKPAVASASPPAAPAAPEHKELFFPEFWDAFHNPTPWLSMGMDHRFRSIWADNIDRLNDKDRQHQYEFQRYRTRWWTKWTLNDDISFNTRLTWEFRTWDEPPRKPQDVDFDEALFDWFNVRWQNVGGLPLTAVIGRQDLILGSGWLVLDGTPLDGSRTIFTDAARFTYMMEEQKTKIELVYVDQASESDRWLKPISDEDRALAKADERGAIVYLTNNSVEKTQLEGFFIYKNDNPVDVAFTEDPALPAAWSQKAENFTFGGAIAGSVGENWKYRAEGAIQTGTKTGNVGAAHGVEQDLEAYGALTNLTYSFKDSLNNSVHIGYEYASGDDPGTSDNEQFDLLWAEWPRWSELFIYTYTYETSIAESTNLHRANIGHAFDLNKQWRIETDYHALWADENTGTVLPVVQTSDDHKFRGHLFTCWAKYKFSPQLYGHLLGEYFTPGNYYEKSNNDDAFWLRFNVEYVF